MIFKTNKNGVCKNLLEMLTGNFTHAAKILRHENHGSSDNTKEDSKSNHYTISHAFQTGIIKTNNSVQKVQN